MAATGDRGALERARLVAHRGRATWGDRLVPLAVGLVLMGASVSAVHVATRQARGYELTMVDTRSGTQFPVPNPTVTRVAIPRPLTSLKVRVTTGPSRSMRTSSDVASRTSTTSRGDM